jgi:hypothetical protein
MTVSIIAAPIKEYPKPKDEAIMPATIGPVACPTSIIEPSVPIAEPLVFFLLKSAINAEVADVTIERQNPNSMLKMKRGVNDLNKKKNPIHSDPTMDPTNI